MIGPWVESAEGVAVFFETVAGERAPDGVAEDLREVRGGAGQGDLEGVGAGFLCAELVGGEFAFEDFAAVFDDEEHAGVFGGELWVEEPLP